MQVPLPMVLIMALDIRCRSTALAANNLGKSVTLPVTQGRVPITINNQKMELVLDSAFWGILVIDGDWYEHERGKGACEKDRRDCYFGTRDKFRHSQQSDKPHPIYFGLNKTYACKRRSGELVLGDQNLTHLTFRVCQPTIESDGYVSPGLFGISMMPTTGNEWISPPIQKSENLIEMLTKYHLIDRPSYTFRPNTGPVFNSPSGQLTIGATHDVLGKSNIVSSPLVYHPVRYRPTAAVWVSSVALLHADGNLTTKTSFEHRRPQSFLAVTDTGSNALYLPYLEDDIIRELRRALLEKGYKVDQLPDLYRKESDGFLRVTPGILGSLPIGSFTK